MVGFTDTERHALNTVFRLSEQRETVYCLWMADAPEAPRLALVDGQSYEARLELESTGQSGLQLIWVGAVSPASAWRVFERPILWPEVVQAMDVLFAPPPALDFDLDVTSDMEDTRPPDPGPPAKRALIASADPAERLYLRARLALADLTQADEAETGAQALALAQANSYAVALVDFGMPDLAGWTFLKQLIQVRPAIPHVIMTKLRASLADRVRARFTGAQGLFDKPPDPSRLNELLHRV